MFERKSAGFMVNARRAMGLTDPSVEHRAGTGADHV